MIKNVSYVDLISSETSSPTIDSQIIPIHLPYLIKLPSNRYIYTCVNQVKYDNWCEYYKDDLLYMYNSIKKRENILQNLDFKEFSLFCFNFSTKSKPAFEDLTSQTQVDNFC